MRNVEPLVGGTNQRHNWDKGWGRKLVPCNLRMPPSFKGENDIYQHVLLSMFSGRLCHNCTAISIISFLT
jgi:hypothetical protein